VLFKRRLPWEPIRDCAETLRQGSRPSLSSIRKRLFPRHVSVPKTVAIKSAVATNREGPAVLYANAMRNAATPTIAKTPMIAKTPLHLRRPLP
jgi:hypothetical protein